MFRPRRRRLLRARPAAPRRCRSAHSEAPEGQSRESRLSEAERPAPHPVTSPSPAPSPVCVRPRGLRPAALLPSLRKAAAFLKAGALTYVYAERFLSPLCFPLVRSIPHGRAKKSTEPTAAPAAPSHPAPSQLLGHFQGSEKTDFFFFLTKVFPFLSFFFLAPGLQQAPGPGGREMRAVPGSPGRWGREHWGPGGVGQRPRPRSGTDAPQPPTLPFSC